MAKLIYGSETYDLPDHFSLEDFKHEIAREKNDTGAAHTATFELKRHRVLYVVVGPFPLAFIDESNEHEKTPRTATIL